LNSDKNACPSGILFFNALLSNANIL